MHWLGFDGSMNGLDATNKMRLDAKMSIIALSLSVVAFLSSFGWSLGLLPIDAHYLRSATAAE